MTPVDWTLLSMALVGVISMAYATVWTVRYEPLYKCRNCGRWVGRQFKGDKRLKPQLRRDHEKRCLA